MAAVTAFLGTELAIGHTVSASVLSSVVGLLVLAAWVIAMTRMDFSTATLGGRRFSRTAFVALVVSAALFLNVLVLVGAVLVTIPALTGEIVGALLAGAWICLALFLAPGRPTSGTPRPASA
jgi:predicted membrane protein